MRAKRLLFSFCGENVSGDALGRVLHSTFLAGVIDVAVL